jgi:hypothetical protein
MTIPSTPPAHQAAAVHPPAAKPQAPAAKAPKEDTVQLSPAAQAAASGDVDHDGDSH